MKFLTKYSPSEITTEGLVYILNGDNFRLRSKLLEEQSNFCAYTEKFITKIDSTEVEHFDPSKKGHDDYYNYYTTLRYANEQKISKYNEYKGSQFFNDLFFQDNTQFKKRIFYKDFIYDVHDENDNDAKNLINYLGFNDDYLFEERLKHIDRLKLTIGSFTQAEQLEYFRKNPNDLNFITAIEFELGLDLSEFLNK